MMRIVCVMPTLVAVAVVAKKLFLSFFGGGLCFFVFFILTNNM